MTTRRLTIITVAIVAVVVALNLLAGGLDRAVGGSQPTGPDGSSYAASAQGLAAYATLLTHFGHPIDRIRGPLDHASLDPRDTLVVLDPDVVTEDESAAMLEFVTAGGRLVIGGPSPYYLQRLRDTPPSWSPDSPTRFTQTAPELGDIGVVVTAGQGQFDDLHGRAPLVREGTHVLVTQEHVGDGLMIFVADASPFQNALLAQGGNSAMALDLAGPSDRPVAFAEGVHGYGAARGLDALPARWKWALLGLAVAVLLFVWSRARRLGPPDRPARELPPPRAEYVDALARTLERTPDRGAALEPVRQWARARVESRGGLRAGATDEEIDRVAEQLGCRDDERAALRAPATGDADVLALGRCVARMSGEGGQS